jgi:hypothetical protein
MPPKTPERRYSNKPVRKLRLPKIALIKRKGLFEEYPYVFLAAIFIGVAILGKAGSMSGFNAVVAGAWIAAFVWFATQLRGYFAQKSKAANEKRTVTQTEEQTTVPQGPPLLPPGMKPMIGLQWPVKPGARPAWPRLPKEKRTQPGARASISKAASTPQEQPVQKPSVQAPPVPGPPNRVPSEEPAERKEGFVYERPTLPERKPRLPHNWPKPRKPKPKR